MLELEGQKAGGGYYGVVGLDSDGDKFRCLVFGGYGKWFIQRTVIFTSSVSDFKDGSDWEQQDTKMLKSDYFFYNQHFSLPPPAQPLPNQCDRN